MKALLMLFLGLAVLGLSAFVLQETHWAPAPEPSIPLAAPAAEPKNPPPPLKPTLEEVTVKMGEAFRSLPLRGEGMGMAEDSRKYHELLEPIRELVRGQPEAQDLFKNELKKCAVENKATVSLRGMCLSEFRSLSKKQGKRPEEQGVPQFLRQQVDRWESPGI